MIDGRLLAPAAGAWLAAALTQVGLVAVSDLVARHDAALRVVALGAVLTAAGVALVAVRRTSLAVVFALASVGVVASAGQVVALTPAPLAAWADAHATATVDGVVVGEPVRRVSSAGASWQPARWEVRVATSAIGARGQMVAVDVPVTAHLPATAEAPRAGSHVHLSGRLAPPWRSGDAAELAVSGTAAVVAQPGAVDAAAQAMRDSLRAALTGIAPDAAALVAGLAVGDESGQSDELDDAMTASGLSHLTAVSGGNVAIVLAVALGTATLARIRMVLRVAVALATLAFFVALVGPQPSVLRATVMGAVVVVGLLTGGRGGGPSVLASAVLLLVLTSPALAVSWGFALSAGATAGLVLLAPRVERALAGSRLTRRWPPAVRTATAITLAAQLATLPVLVAMGSTVGWVSVPANLLAMPAVAPVTVLGLAAASVGVVMPAVAAVIGHVAAVPAGWIAVVAFTAGDLPFARMAWPSGATGAAVVGAVVAVLFAARQLPRRVVAAGVVAVLGAAAIWVLAPPGRRAWPPPGWLLIMCDVGQGDAILVRDSADSVVVVDAGPDPDRIDRCLDDAAAQAVSAVVLTHFHADHVDGLPGVLRGRAVGAVLVNPIRDPTDRAARVDEWCAAAGLVAEPIGAGDRRQVGAVSWEAVWPRRRIDAGSVPNNASIVLDVHVGGHSVLLTGDVEPEAQAAIGPALAGRHFDVVKVPHHGSQYQDARLPVWVPPAIALVSVGADNDYGHPAQATLDAWAAVGARVARSDRDGDVAVVAVDGGLGVATRRG